MHNHNVLKSSGTSPNFRNTVASLKSPVAGLPVRLRPRQYGRSPSKVVRTLYRRTRI
jgi:hypothetical protein